MNAPTDTAHPALTPAPWATDPYANALRNGHGPLFLRRTDGWLLPLDVERWCADADTADLSALRRCEGPVLDVGCGPGRLVAELAAHGHRALGIDVSEAAVARTLRLGGSALHRSVFDPLPGEGRWGTVLLIDGNIGIGGDPHALLHRAAELLAPGGLLIAETTAQDIDERVLVRLDDGRGGTGAETGTETGAGAGAGAGAGSGAGTAAGGTRSGAATEALFPWARLSTPALLRYARPPHWQPVDQWETGGRPFVSLRLSSTARTTNQSADAANSPPVISSQFPRNTSGESPLADS
ncbi:methyltransferase domain-containing protein [Streptomyces finlayi]|uniref:Methyltransferase domain-containing protein n=1 Tax=Streptomyces finlayi TaxID=67296 RepID=A0A7G7BLY4_9ACTN|nr:class I SAM-dependent methyltransferase [Streptomyces finlayi]QNE76349.1 methyltransferase domain-containing protein [Streptomyces finlayi]